MTFLGTKIFILGGYCGSFDDEIFVFDTGINPFDLNNEIFVIMIICKLCLILKETNHWDKLLTSGPAPFGRAYHSACAIGSKIYVFGGYNSRATLQDLYILDTGIIRIYYFEITIIEDLNWYNPMTTGTIPSPRFEHSMVAVGVYIYLFGGGNSLSWLNELFIFDTGFSLSHPNLPFRITELDYSYTEWYVSKWKMCSCNECNWKENFSSWRLRWRKETSK